jgi:intracellular septation protein
MQLFFDLAPIIVFFVVYKFAGIFAATGAIIAATGIQIAYQWIRHRKIQKLTLFSGIAVAVLGGITLIVRNPIFIQWKPTIVYGVLGAVFLGNQLLGSKTLIQRAVGHLVELEPGVWRQLNLLWAANFIILSAANLFVVYHFDEATWVNFKVYGSFGFFGLAAIVQTLIVLRAERRAAKESSR